MAIHTMLDLETLSLANNAMILSIGAVKFDADQIIDRFHVGILPEVNPRYSLHIDFGTVMWWFDPAHDAARRAIWELPKVDLFAALDSLDLWMKQTPDHQRGSLWGNGAIFDIVKINSACDAVKLDHPVTYKREECYRTMKNRCPDVEFEQLGAAAHVALDDAESQAVHLQRICRKYGIEL